MLADNIMFYSSLINFECNKASVSNLILVIVPSTSHMSCPAGGLLALIYCHTSMRPLASQSKGLGFAILQGLAIGTLIMMSKAILSPIFMLVLITFTASFCISLNYIIKYF